jgi:hypothetical protein
MKRRLFLIGSLTLASIIIGLAASIAIGFLLNILACVLFGQHGHTNWWPFLTVVTYFLAALPNAICSYFAPPEDPFSSGERGSRDTGYFLTGALVVSGFGVLAVLRHANKIETPAMVLAMMGGLIVYATILLWLHFFHNRKDEDETF